MSESPRPPYAYKHQLRAPERRSLCATVNAFDALLQARHPSRSCALLRDLPRPTGSANNFLNSFGFRQEHNNHIFKQQPQQHQPRGREARSGLDYRGRKRREDRPDFLPDRPGASGYTQLGICKILSTTGELRESLAFSESDCTKLPFWYLAF